MLCENKSRAFLCGAQLKYLRCENYSRVGKLLKIVMNGIGEGEGRVEMPMWARGELFFHNKFLFMLGAIVYNGEEYKNVPIIPTPNPPPPVKKNCVTYSCLRRIMLTQGRLAVQVRMTVVL